jgi:hypothetical protein
MQIPNRRLRHLQDRIARGLGTAARHIGTPYDAFRPCSIATPLDPANRYLRLPAAFTAEDSSFRRPVGYGRAAWTGIFDSAYTQRGDYLVGPAGTFFIAAQEALLPALCVLASRTLSVARAAAPTVAGVNSYGGLTAATVTPVLSGWPASILFAGTGSPGDLPGDASIPTWSVLLPNTPATIRAADLLTDDRGQSYVVGSAELTALGWRILAKQAAP